MADKKLAEEMAKPAARIQTPREVYTPLAEPIAVLRQRLERFMARADRPETASRAYDTSPNRAGVARVRTAVSTLLGKLQAIYGCQSASEAGLCPVGIVRNRDLTCLFATVESLKDLLDAPGESGVASLPGGKFKEFLGAVKPIEDLLATQAPKKRRMSREEAEKAANRLFLEQGKAFMEKTAKQWAGEIGCSVSTVSKLELWRRNMSKSGRGRGRRGKGAEKPAPTEVVSLSKKIEAQVGEGSKDELLLQMIAQEEDFEPSPLDDDPPDKPPLRVKTKKK